MHLHFLSAEKFQILPLPVYRGYFCPQEITLFSLEYMKEDDMQQDMRYMSYLHLLPIPSRRDSDHS